LTITDDLNGETSCNEFDVYYMLQVDVCVAQQSQQQAGTSEGMLPAQVACPHAKDDWPSAKGAQGVAAGAAGAERGE
jgi:hypothetical protein